MSTTVVDRTMPSTRVPSGIPGLDGLVGGGFPFHRTVLLCGDIGTGKTTFGLQFLMEGARRGEAGVLVSVDEKPRHVLEDARRFGWDVDGATAQQLVTVLEASPCFTALRGKNGLDARQIASDLTQQIRRVKASRLVIDGATSLVPYGAPVAGVEDFVRSLIVALEDNLGCTIVLTTRTSVGTHTSPVGPTAERLSSGVIELKLDPLGRSLLVRKMRGAPMALGERSFDIVDGRGLVLPGHTMRPHKPVSAIAPVLHRLVTLDGEAAIIDPGQAPYVLKADRCIELSPEPVTATYVETLIAELLPADVRAKLNRLGAAQHDLPASQEFPAAVERPAVDSHATGTPRRAGSETFALLAPLSGVVVPLDRVPDPVFAQRLAGDGVSIDPTSTILLAPCDGSVTQVHRAGHAVTLRTSHGLEIMMHIGLDTVELGGRGFTPQVCAGQQVHTGDALIAFDADYVATHARSLLTQIIVTNMDRVARLTVGTGLVTAAREVVLSVVPLGGPAAAAPEPVRGEFLRSAPVVVAAGSGLHARPAAVVAARARGYAAEVRLVKNEREANARSVVSIMALEVDGGDTVTVMARGADAHAAIAGISDTLSGGIGEAPAGAPAAYGTLPPTPPARTAAGPPDLLRGVAASPGVAIGRIFQLRHEDTVVEEQAADANHERRALEAAIASAHLQLEALQVRLTADADADRAAIFAAHRELLEDPELLDAAAQHIRAGAIAAYAWQLAYRAQAGRLVALRNPLIAGRAVDLADVGRRVLHLLAGAEHAPHDIPADAIVVAEDLAPSDAASLDRARLRGFCMTLGSATSHAAILARALGIPAVAGIDPRALDVASGTRAILDGTRGVLQLDPSEDDEVSAATRQRVGEDRRRTDLALAMNPAVTTDGHRIEVAANIGSEDEAREVPSSGGEGVGLLRTEFLFMERRTAPDEEEQTRAYEAIARALGPERMLVIRTLDVGGDKPLSYLPIGTEPNPFLGERGIRLLLNRRDVLEAQVRAIVRASRVGRIAVMFPMIATFAEWTAARDMVEAVRRDLGVPPIPVGIMVETAAAALLADVFAEQADFFSIGTNDLTQYTLAMDRSNPRLAPQIDGLHPAVLRLIDRTVVGAHARNRWVGVCGALAADPQAVPILIGLGVDELSVAVPALPAVKAQVRTLDLERCRALARQALAAPDAMDVRALVPRREDS